MHGRGLACGPARPTVAPGAAVEAAVKEDGKDAFDAVVLQTFDDPDAAVAREHELLLEYDAADSPDSTTDRLDILISSRRLVCQKHWSICAAMRGVPKPPRTPAPRKH